MSKVVGIAIVTAFATVVAGCNGGDGGSTSRTDAILALTGDPSNGQAEYGATCAVCHGASGEGSASYPALAGTSLADDAIVDEIISGNDQGMPAYGDQFDDQTIADILAFVKTL
jgi:mono/diheme cytochrome c family protein